ncbi:hypothetical protein GIB67_018456, partial [Kingdonia uniflora]
NRDSMRVNGTFTMVFKVWKDIATILPYWFYEYCRVGHPIVKEEVKFSAYSCLIAWERGNRRKTNDQARFLDYEQFVVGEERETYASYWAEEILERIPGLQFAWGGGGARLGWYIEWSGRREMLPIARLRDPPLMSSSYDAEELWHLTHSMWRLVLTESARDTQRFKELENELAIAHIKIDSIDCQLYAHDLQLRSGRDVRVVPLPPGGSARTRQRKSGP